jgi:hypothetical protein
MTFWGGGVGLGEVFFSGVQKLLKVEEKSSKSEEE